MGTPSELHLAEEISQNAHGVREEPVSTSSGFLTTLTEALQGQLCRLDNGCLEWIGARNKDGYGVVCHRRESWLGGWTSEAVHRYAYRLCRGEIPRGRYVRQTCGNKLCCWPEHLALHRGRRHGETASEPRAYRSRLNKAQAFEVRRLKDSGETIADIAARFHATPHTILNVLAGRTFPLPKPKKRRPTPIVFPSR